MCLGNPHRQHPERDDALVPSQILRVGVGIGAVLITLILPGNPPPPQVEIDPCDESTLIAEFDIALRLRQPCQNHEQSEPSLTWRLTPLANQLGSATSPPTVPSFGGGECSLHLAQRRVARSDQPVSSHHQTYQIQIAPGRDQRRQG